MASWTSLQKVNIRRYLGVTSLFRNFDPSVEDAITAALSVADGGAQDDSTLQEAIILILADLATLETDLKALWCKFAANRVEELTIDAARARAVLLAEGRRLVGVLADMLDVAPRRDVFSAKTSGYELKGERNSPWV